MNELANQYRSRRSEVLLPAASAIENFIVELLEGVPRIDRVSARAKSLESFMRKALAVKEDGRAKYAAPLNDIQDQLGVRVIVFYKDDISIIKNVIEKYLRPIEIKSKSPDRESEFGYFGQHFMLIIPDDIWPEGVRPINSPAVFELQVKTLFQHAWSEACHDLGYKGKPIPGPDVNRNLALASAQAWGADQIFSELFGRVQNS